MQSLKASAHQLLLPFAKAADPFGCSFYCSKGHVRRQDVEEAFDSNGYIIAAGVRMLSSLQHIEPC